MTLSCLHMSPHTVPFHAMPLKSSCPITELQIRRSTWDNSKIILFFLFLNENIPCDPSLELSRCDISHEELQHMFEEKFEKDL